MVESIKQKRICGLTNVCQVAWKLGKTKKIWQRSLTNIILKKNHAKKSTICKKILRLDNIKILRLDNIKNHVCQAFRKKTKTKFLL